MEWIKFSEALPPTQDYYLVVKKGPQITFVPFVARYKKVPTDKGIIGAFVDNDGDEVSPTHWMPLPEPPKE